jgi:hypothetical protein
VGLRQEVPVKQEVGVMAVGVVKAEPCAAAVGVVGIRQCRVM